MDRDQAAETLRTIEGMHKLTLAAGTTMSPFPFYVWGASMLAAAPLCLLPGKATPSIVIGVALLAAFAATDLYRKRLPVHPSRPQRPQRSTADVIVLVVLLIIFGRFILGFFFGLIFMAAGSNIGIFMLYSIAAVFAGRMAYNDLFSLAGGFSMFMIIVGIPLSESIFNEFFLDRRPWESVTALCYAVFFLLAGAIVHLIERRHRNAPINPGLPGLPGLPIEPAPALDSPASDAGIEDPDAAARTLAALEALRKRTQAGARSSSYPLFVWAVAVLAYLPLVLLTPDQSELPKLLIHVGYWCAAGLISSILTVRDYRRRPVHPGTKKDDAPAGVVFLFALLVLTPFMAFLPLAIAGGADRSWQLLLVSMFSMYIGIRTHNAPLAWCGGLSIALIPVSALAGGDLGPPIATLGYAGLFAGTGLALATFQRRAA